MKNELDNQMNETPGAMSRTHQLPPFLRLVEARERSRKFRLSLRVPRKQSCQRRAMLAALREAELSDWEASGGDYLASMHPPII